MSARLAALLEEVARRGGVRFTVAGEWHEVRGESVPPLHPEEDRVALSLENLALMMRADPEGAPAGDGALTGEERGAVNLLGLLWGDLCSIVGDGPTRDDDLREAMHHVHALQRMVASNAAARAYPGQFRPLGGRVGAPAREPFDHEAFGVPRRPR